MRATYDHRTVEAHWAKEWERSGLFHADPGSDRPKFSIVLPPPSVSARLHMGHALQTIVQDVYARYRRMTGCEVLWLPGLDHAMIATQRNIERDLARTGLTKEMLGRAGFTERLARWTEEFSGAIVGELRELGASIDLPRLRFTMDEASRHSVRTAFVRLWDAGLIYRELRLVNWCVACSSVLSDGQISWVRRDRQIVALPVDLCDHDGDPVRDPGDELIPGTAGGPSRLVVHTGRPELLSAVVAVVVDPTQVTVAPGTQAVLPRSGVLVPVVSDGDACRRIRQCSFLLTPGHDPLHWEVAVRHGLPVRVVLDEQGRLVPDAGVSLAGLPVADARQRVIQELDSQGQLAGQVTRAASVPLCERCSGDIEQMASRQWFVAMDQLAERARSALDQGQPRFHPARYAVDYRKWLDGLRDWCVSRQLWMGPQIPVFTCACGHQFAAVDDPSHCPRCSGTQLSQETDVLDTWFSQAIWQASALGWPDPNAALMAFHPTAVTVASRDILPLGISKMIMVSLGLIEAMPFDDVVITCVVLAPDGRKMDTAKGTAIPPGEIIAAQGADALRGWAITAATKGQDIRFDPGLVTAWRRTIVKLWNATRLVIADNPPTPVSPDAEDDPADQWILSRLRDLIVTTTSGIESFELHRSAQALTTFIRTDFCGRYLEQAKPRLHAGDPRCRATASQVLDVVLRLLHPLLPFATEELWHQLPGDRPLLERCPWPIAADYPEAEDTDRNAGITSRAKSSMVSQSSGGRQPRRKSVTPSA